MSLFRSGSRSRAATAAFLSSLFPGAGQAYNRQWLKAGVTAAVVLSLLFTITTALASILLKAAGTGMLDGTATLTAGAMARQLAPAMVDQGVLADMRSRVLLPAVLLVGVGIWSMVDGYRVARRQAGPRPPSSPPHSE